MGDEARAFKINNLSLPLGKLVERHGKKAQKPKSLLTVKLLHIFPPIFSTQAIQNQNVTWIWMELLISLSNFS